MRSALGLGAGLSLTQMLGDSVLEASFAGARGGNTLVVLSLRGGIDGLGAVVPHGDPGYYSARKTIAVPADQLICKDAMFGLHPKLGALTPLWDSGELAAVQAVGLPVVNRSHFSAMEAVEDAAPGSSARTGWINRMVGVAKGSGAPASVNGGVMDAVGLGQPYPTTALTGDAPVLTAANLDGLRLYGLDKGFEAGRYDGLAAVWGTANPLRRAAEEAVSFSESTGVQLSAAASAAPYPTVWNAAPFAAPLKSAAGLIRADLGTDVIAIDAGSWDHHNDYGTTQWGQMQSSLEGLGKSLKAFFDDLGALRSRVTVVTISEFGRRVAENGNQGLDHGWGNMMLVAGAGVRGGRYYGTWPRLDAAALAEGDLKVTTDYRSVLWEVISRRFPDRSLPGLFPGFINPQTVGVMA